MFSSFLLYRCNRSKKKGIIQETNIPPLTKWSEQSSITFVKCWDDSLPFYAGNFKPGCNFDLFLGWFCWRRTSSNDCCLMQSVNLIISGRWYHNLSCEDSIGVFKKKSNMRYMLRAGMPLRVLQLYMAMWKKLTTSRNQPEDKWAWGSFHEACLTPFWGLSTPRNFHSAISR